MPVYNAPHLCPQSLWLDTDSHRFSSWFSVTISIEVQCILVPAPLSQDLFRGQRFTVYSFSDVEYPGVSPGCMVSVRSSLRCGTHLMRAIRWFVPIPQTLRLDTVSQRFSC